MANTYIEDYLQACERMKANRDLIAFQFLACLQVSNADSKIGYQQAIFILDHVKTYGLKSMRARWSISGIWHNNVEDLVASECLVIILGGASALARQEQEQVQPTFAYVHNDAKL
ncbi:RNA ligase [Venturia nashicola]|uniref:RNA ligase n=1 Tax=Venturia nashicola TaxID=86259 RepID=A0A4Z1PI01_9PEZI|nr:RNA ligase [Venturia nashicola]